MDSSNRRTPKPSKPKKNDAPPPPGVGGEGGALGDGDSDMMIARLALWAGDFEGAETRLSAMAGGRDPSSGDFDFDYVTRSSARRLLRQLRRKMTEYGALAAAAGLESTLVEARPAMRSEGGHLAAIVWAETNWEYELRCYLADPAWEADFYTRAADLSQAENAAARVRSLSYGADQAFVAQEGADEGQGDALAELDLAWAARSGPMFLQPTVSDFCTCTVRGVWTTPARQISMASVEAAFQRFLDAFDPG